MFPHRTNFLRGRVYHGRALARMKEVIWRQSRQHTPYRLMRRILTALQIEEHADIGLGQSGLSVSSVVTKIRCEQPCRRASSMVLVVAVNSTRD
jgi:tartrate dehydratase alpha subunit/fumarate hydratase class I-like protein